MAILVHDPNQKKIGVQLTETQTVKGGKKKKVSVGHLTVSGVEADEALEIIRNAFEQAEKEKATQKSKKAS